MRINWNEPRFDNEEIEEVRKVLVDNYVNEGPKTKEFEEVLKNYLGVKYVILTTNATAALFLAIKADSIIKDIHDFEVIVPDMTMIATAMAVDWAGGNVSLVDIRKDDLTIDYDKIEEKITSKTTAIIPVHTLGRSADMDKIIELSKKHNLTIIEDAAGALGSKEKESYLGTIGKVGCYSLQSNKIITSGQGGIIVTNDEKYNEVMRRLRDFGRASNKEFIHQKIGYNLKFSDLSAALGIAQFRKIEKRKKLLIKQLDMYKDNLINLIDKGKIKFFEYSDGEVPIWVDVIVEDRDKLAEYLKKENIYTRECWPAIHQNPPFSGQGTDMDFPNSAFASKNVIWLPNGPAVGENEIKLICKKIVEFYNL